MPIMEEIKKAEQEAEQLRLQASEEAEQMIENAKVTAIQETKRLDEAFEDEMQKEANRVQNQIQQDQLVMQASWHQKDEKMKQIAKQKMKDAIDLILSKVDSL